MKHLKTIVLATMLATAAGVAQARDSLPVETSGRGVPAESKGIVAPSIGGNIEVANVQGRGPNFVQADSVAGKGTMTAVLAGVNEVQGRS